MTYCSNNFTLEGKWTRFSSRKTKGP